MKLCNIYNPIVPILKVKFHLQSLIFFSENFELASVEQVEQTDMPQTSKNDIKYQGKHLPLFY